MENQWNYWLIDELKRDKKQLTVALASFMQSSVSDNEYLTYLASLLNEERQSKEPCILIRYKSLKFSIWFSVSRRCFFPRLNEVLIENSS